MNQIDKSTDCLISEIQSSYQYIRYHECLEKLKSQKELFHKFDEFRKKYYKLTNEGVDNFDQVEELQRNYHETLMNSDVTAFMEATDRMCLFMKEIYIKIADEVNMDIDFIDDSIN